MLEITKLNKHFGENHVLKDINLKIESKKTTVVIGSSGSGKSTLLRCINLLEIPDSGKIDLDGFTLDFSKKEPKSRCISFTKKDSYPHQLSGGQQQRIAIARALSMKPELLLFDEPTSALDPELEADVFNLIKDLAKENYTIIVVTHNMGFARDVSDEVIFVNKGEILAKGSYRELTNLDNDRIRQFLSFFKEA